ncbi:reverse transcriptase domain-containing protein [Aminobacter carboxidus]|uniref:Reverse transcriptase domain-containing protein n=1 Tax=Aminobacter carboxidus TaxID=376165 RepID=A0ABR9GQ66_9HYPH|nr:hypothetical protein [Aminobacter carboxidus]
MANEIWKKAISIKGLEAGWHLTRAELANGFYVDQFSQQAVAQNLTAQIAEIRRQLITDSYRFRPLRQVPIPKGSLSTRPGSHLPLRDRMVLWSVVRGLAPVFDGALSDNVYSYRLKENPKQGELFKEGDALEIPFLKRKSILQELDPFEPWYDSWPDFEKRTREEIGSGYNYLSVADISGYFENINIDILKDHISSELKSEPILCNFVHSGLSEWVNVTQGGFRPKRSIPQGSGISSFFGNIYLIPIDESFEDIKGKYDFKYIRYMDDIRIFSRDLSTARMVIFRLERLVRDLHLSLQNSKTKILIETAGDKQITNSLFDDRIDRIAEMRELLNGLKISEKNAAVRLHAIARSTPANGDSKRLLGVKDPKSGLTDRAMRMWMNMCIHVGSTDYLGTLKSQVYTNPDQRLSKIFVNSCIMFPRISTLGSTAEDFIKSVDNIHPHQESELIHGCRYLSNIPEGIWKRALGNVTSGTANFQLRTQSLLLLGMRSHTNEITKNIWRAMRKDHDVANHPFYISVLGHFSGEDRSTLKKYYMHHANPQNQEFGLLLEKFDSDDKAARNFLDFAFSNDVSLSDWQGILFYMCGAKNKYIRDYLLKLARLRIRGGGRQMLVARLAALRNRLVQQ